MMKIKAVVGIGIGTIALCGSAYYIGKKITRRVFDNAKSEPAITPTPTEEPKDEATITEVAFEAPTVLDKHHIKKYWRMFNREMEKIDWRALLEKETKVEVHHIVHEECTNPVMGDAFAQAGL